MTAPQNAFESRWQAAVMNLSLAIELMQATADKLPLDLGWALDYELRQHPFELLHLHVTAFYEYTTALTCVQALLKQQDRSGP